MTSFYKGSSIAKNEFDVVKKFNNWKIDDYAKKWLQVMGYDITEIDKVVAVKVKGAYKSDVQAQIEIYFKNLIEAQNISVKLCSNKNGFNQVDKRWVDKYKELWEIPDDITILLKKFTGEIPNHSTSTRDESRIFLDEISEEGQNKILTFFEDNKTLILSDILKGRGILSAEWMLVANKIVDENDRYVLQPINKVLNYYSSGEVKVTKRGSLKIGRITMQRKGGDGGRNTANMLQFKFNPNEIFNI
jgi:hypothetical protein